MHTENGLDARGEQLNGVKRLHAHQIVKLGDHDHVLEVCVELGSLRVVERARRVRRGIDALPVVAVLLLLRLLDLLELEEAFEQQVVGVVDQVVEELEEERLLAVLDVRVRLVRQCAHLPSMLVEQAGCVVGNITPVTNTTKSVAHIPKEIDQFVHWSTVVELLLELNGLAAHLDAHEHVEQRFADTRGLRVSRECVHGQHSLAHLSAECCRRVVDASRRLWQQDLETFGELSSTMRIEEAVGMAHVGDRERDESIQVIAVAAVVSTHVRTGRAPGARHEQLVETRVDEATHEYEELANVSHKVLGHVLQNEWRVVAECAQMNEPSGARAEKACDARKQTLGAQGRLDVHELDGH